MAYGMDGHIGMTFQTSYGTAYTSSVDYFPFISESLTEGIEELADDSMRGRRDESLSREGRHTVEGDVVFDIDPLLIGKIIQGFTNHNSGTLVGSVYTHSFKPASTDWDGVSAVPPMTLEVYRGVDSSFQYADMCVNQFTIEIEDGAISKSTASFVGGKFAWLTGTSPSFVTGSSFSWDVASIQFAGSAVSNVSALTLTFMNNLEAKGTVNGTKIPSRIKRTAFRAIEISGTMFFDDDAEYTKFLARTEQTLTVDFVGASITASQNNAMTIDIPSMVYNTSPVNMGGAGELEVSFGAKGYYNAGSVTAVEFTLVNTKAMY